jgi:methionyl aminopeptidase
MVEIKTDAQLDAMREAGRIVAQALAAMRRHAAVGVSLEELNDVAHAGTSVNDVIVHGIPDGYRLRDGDLVSIDCGAHLDGWAGDAAVSFTVGTPRPGDMRLIDATNRALDAGIAAADGWALHTADGSRAAHAEHTVAITSGGPRILTLP